MEKLPRQFYYKKNRLQQLRGFYYAAQLQSVSKAAQHMLLTQSTVSLQIQSLERDLGSKLFDRSKKRFILTDDGKTLYKLAVPLIHGLDGLYDQFHDLQKSDEQRVVDIAAHHIATSYLLPPYLKKFSDSHPDIVLNIRNIPRDLALDKLINNEIDLMIYPTSEVPAECQFKPSFSYEPLLIMPKDHALAIKKTISLEDIAAYNLIRIDQKLITLPLFEEAYKTYGWGSNIQLESGHWEMLKHFVRAGLGIAMVSTICIDERDDDLVGRSMLNYFPEMTYGIMTRKGAFMSDPVKEFITHMDHDYFNES